ncbi:MAG: ABC transporter ATP-binding protein [Actinobacteria bacterium]|nr:ABC transporter ATP-binding protein [Actinomycetota bacterium]
MGAGAGVEPGVLSVEHLVKDYRAAGGAGRVRAVDDVSFHLDAGSTLGIVGESGCGKSTTARLLVRLEEASSGRITLDGTDITHLAGRRLRSVRRRVQLVFQDPYASLNPRLTVGDALLEVLTVHRVGTGTAMRRSRVADLLDMVGLSLTLAGRYPHEMSGGQRQRVGIARALAVRPAVLVLDEPVSALDVSVRAEVMNLLCRLRDELGLTYVFISHDLAMVRHISDRIAVMYLGRLVEVGPWQAVSDAPLHPYTRALQAAVPVADPDAEAARAVSVVIGEVPDAAAPPPGCRFHPRCPIAEPRCGEEVPALVEQRTGHLAACHLVTHERRATVPGDTLSGDTLSGDTVAADQ